MSYIVSVEGEIPAESLGTALSHEHLYCDISPHSGNPDNLVKDIDGVVNELSHFSSAGGDSILEMTTPEIGRSPDALFEISRRTGVHIISGIALYDRKNYPNWVTLASEIELASIFIKELDEGTNGIRAGFIGELASRNEPDANAENYKLKDDEKQVFRGAAAAQQQTGAAIYTHASIGRPGLAQLKVLHAAGANPEKIAIGHCDAQWNEVLDKDLQYYLTILDSGAFCGFDLIGWQELMPNAARAER
ncbi:MAG: hypothetical protein HN368_16610, partial [Spirochaetales bacterium]|nr:hypothetical protein [Spirochaetales bacterium]